MVQEMLRALASVADAKYLYMKIITYYPKS